jgi:hypothetical protein
MVFIIFRGTHSISIQHMAQNTYVRSVLIHTNSCLKPSHLTLALVEVI